MKRIAAIALLSLFLFNVGGYYVVFWGLGLKANDELISRIEKSDYDHEETVMIKVPMSLPYAVKEDYQFVKGKFEHRGTYYNLIKQKLENDTLYIVCIEDVKTGQLNRNMVDYGKLSNDLPAQSKSTQSLLSKLIKEYQGDFQLTNIEHPGWSATITHYCHVVSLTNISLSISSPPPRG